MFNIDSKIPQLPQDKANHALYGVLWGLLGAWIIPMVPLLHMPSFMAATALAALAGIVKEGVDHFNDGDVSAADAIATAAGGFAVTVAILIGP